MTTVGSDDKIPKAVILGADAVYQPREGECCGAREVAHRRARRRCRHRAYRSGGVGHLPSFIGKGGRLVTCGATTGGEVKLNLRYVFSRQLTIKGSYMGTRAELVKAAELMGQGRLIAVIDRTFPLQEARAAQRTDVESKVLR